MLLAKMLIGSCLVLVIHLVAQTKNFYLSGLIPLFPTFALIACYTVGQNQPVGNLKETVLFAMLSLIPYFVYLLSVFLLADKCTLSRCLTFSSCAWLAVAAILVLGWQNHSQASQKKPITLAFDKTRAAEERLIEKPESTTLLSRCSDANTKCLAIPKSL